MKISNVYALLMLTFIVASCKKEHGPNRGNPQQFVLKSVEYQEANAKAEYAYDADGLLEEINYSDGTTAYTTRYDHLNGFIKKVSVSEGLDDQTYSYLNGKIISILLTSLNHADRSDRLAFAYNANGTVSELKYYIIGVGGERLASTSAYEYDNAGRLEKVVSVDAEGMTEWTIESYSSECVFNPFTFIRPALDEAYEIFNYPVLKKLTQLPTKISKRVHPGDRNPYIKSVIATQFVIQNKRIDKAVTTVAFPESPDDDFTSTAIFRY